MIALETIESEFGIISVYRKRSNGAITYMQGGCHQSEADGNGVSLASYIHAIFGLVLEADAENILLIGCGGGTLATMLARTGRSVTVVDINPASFTLAKRYFGLPDSVRCKVADGKSFLRSSTQVYDAVVIDAYHGDRVPGHFQSLRFYGLARDRLSQHGAVFENIHVDHVFDRHVDRVADCMSFAFAQVRLLDSRALREHNAIAMAGAVSHLGPPHLLVPPEMESDIIQSELAAMKFRAWHPER